MPHQKVFEDPDGDPLTYSASSNTPAVASASVSGSVIIITPVSGGKARITITAVDGKAGSASDDFVVSVNEPPTIANSIPNQTLTIQGNSFTRDLNVAPAVFNDADEDELSYTAQSSATNIAVATLSGNTLIVTPLAIGNVTITVQADDKRGGTASTSFEVEIVTGNQSPIVVATPSDTILTLGKAPLAIDLDKVFFDPEHDELSYEANSTPPNIVTTTLEESRFTIAAATGGKTTITLMADDGKGGSARISFNVTVNRRPQVINAMADTVIILSGELVKNLDAVPRVFADPDDDDLTYTVESSRSAKVPATLSGSVLTVKPAAARVAEITVTAHDGKGGQKSTTFKVIVNQPPVVANAITDTTLSVSGADFVRNLNAVPKVFVDPDDDELTYSVVSSKPSRVPVTMSGSVLTVKSEKARTAVITITADDNRGGINQTEFIVNIVDENRVPTIASTLPNQILSVGGSPFTRDLEASPRIFSDPDGDTLEYSVRIDAPDKATANLFKNILTVNPVSIGDVTVTIVAEDSRKDSVITKFNVSIVDENPNQSPTLAYALFDQTIVVGGAAFSRNLNAAPRVFSDADGDSLIYTASSSSPGIATALIFKSTLSVEAVSVGETTIFVTANDSKSGMDSTSFIVTVLPENRPPVIANTIPDQILTIGGVSFIQDLSIVFFDPDSDALTYHVALDTPSIVNANKSGSILTLKPTAIGNVKIEVRADDAKGGVKELSFTTRVATGNQPPIAASGIPDQNLTIGGQSFSRNLSASPKIFTDLNGDPLAFSASSTVPAIAAASVVGSVLTITPGASGVATIVITANDNSGGTDSTQFTVTVAETQNSAPILTSAISNQTLTVGGASFTKNLNTVFSDSENDELEFTADTDNWEVVEVIVVENILAISPKAIGSATIIVLANDGYGVWAENTFTVTVEESKPASITTSALASHNKAVPLIIGINIAADIGIERVTLHYRQGGESNFSLGEVSTNFQQGTIPGTAVTARGLEYYLEASNENGAKTQSDTFSVKVKWDVSRDESKPNHQASGSEQNAYRLISIPFDLDKKNPGQVLEDDLGEYTRKSWRFFQLLNDQQYQEFPNDTVMTPGGAFWLIVKEGGKVIDTGAGYSNSLAEPYQITLHRQWNFIGNPFNFTIPILNLRLNSNGQPPVLRKYDGSWSEAAELEPYEGYAIFNATDTTDVLTVDPDLSSTGLLRTVSLSQPDTLWFIRIVAQCQSARDDDNFAVVIANASPEWDAFDRPEAADYW